MSYGYVIRKSYVSALQVLGSEMSLDARAKQRIDDDRITKAKYIGPRKHTPNHGWHYPYVNSADDAGKYLEVEPAIDFAFRIFDHAPQTESGLIIEVVSLEDNLVHWKRQK